MVPNKLFGLDKKITMRIREVLKEHIASFSGKIKTKKLSMRTAVILMKKYMMVISVWMGLLTQTGLHTQVLKK